VNSSQSAPKWNKRAALEQETEIDEEAELRQYELAEAAPLYIAFQSEGKSFDPAALGFEFTATEIEAFLESQNPSTRAA
jgi:hypothetical protein